MMIVKVHDRFTIGSREDPWSECVSTVLSNDSTLSGQQAWIQASSLKHTRVLLQPHTVHAHRSNCEVFACSSSPSNITQGRTKQSGQALSVWQSDSANPCWNRLYIHAYALNALV
jgi:hypothetical protein